jgi:hypothetical protein
MQKTGRKRWQTLVLIALTVMLGAGLLIQGVQTVLSWLGPLHSASRVEQGTSVCTVTLDKAKLGGQMLVGKKEVVCGDVSLFGSILVVKGQVRGDILAFGSNIYIAGNLRGDVNLYGGVVTIQNGSHVYGNVNLFGGREKIENGAQLDGTVINRSQHLSLWLPGLSPQFDFPFWSLLIWVSLGLAITSLLPEHVMFVRTTVTNKTRRSLLLGLLSLVLAPTVLFVLIALIIPIPLAILLAFGFLAAWALGTIAVGWQLGDFLLRVCVARQSSRLAQVAVGLTIIVLIGSLPYIGWIVSLLAGLLGLGGALLSRFGTRLYSRPRQPLTF